MTARLILSGIGSSCALLLCAALCGCGQDAAACECPATTIQVTTLTGAPVCGATVTLTLPEGGTWTSPQAAQDGDAGSSAGTCDGFYPLALDPGQSGTVTVSAPGFHSTTETISEGPPSCCPLLTPASVVLVASQ